MTPRLASTSAGSYRAFHLNECQLGKPKRTPRGIAPNTALWALASHLFPLAVRSFLRRFPVQSVNFFAAGVSQDQWGVIPRETRPLPRDAPSQALAAQARDQLKFPVADPYAVHGRLGDVRVDKVNVTPIVGPVRIIRGTAYQFCPLVSAEVEQHQFRRI